MSIGAGFGNGNSVALCLKLLNIPCSWYISPEAMTALTSELSTLEELSFRIQSPQYRPDLESLSESPPRRSILCSQESSFRAAQIVEYFLGGSQSIRIYRHQAVCCCVMALRSPYIHRRCF